MTPSVLKAVIERKDPLDLFVHSPTLCLSLFPLKQQFFFVLPPPCSVLLSKDSPRSQCRLELGTNSQDDGLSSVSIQMSRINYYINILNDFLIECELWQGSREQSFPGENCCLFLICSYKQFIFKTYGERAMFLLMENPNTVLLASHQFCFYFCGITPTFLGSNSGECSPVTVQL